MYLEFVWYFSIWCIKICAFSLCKWGNCSLLFCWLSCSTSENNAGELISHVEWKKWHNSKKTPQVSPLFMSPQWMLYHHWGQQHYSTSHDWRSQNDDTFVSIIKWYKYFVLQITCVTINSLCCAVTIFPDQFPVSVGGYFTLPTTLLSADEYSWNICLQILHVNGLVQDCCNSSALAMELLQSCTKTLIWPSCRHEEYYNLLMNSNAHFKSIISIAYCNH